MGYPMTDHINSRGKYIVLEGPEGVGKTTQIQVLHQRLLTEGIAVKTFREPDSQSDLTARSIRRMTQDPNYEMNTKTEVLLYNAARAQSLEVIKKNIDQGINCLVDRNFLTTLAIQYYGRSDITDYESINQIINFAIKGIEPDLCIVLDAPVNILKDHLKNRHNGERFDNLDESFLERVRAGYLWEANKRNLPIIFAIGDIDNISQQIWQMVEPILNNANNQKTNNKFSSLAISDTSIKSTLSEEIIEKTPTYINKTKTGHKIVTEDGLTYLKNLVTNTTENVYAFKDNVSSTTVAASMARLSRRGDDLRMILLDEFSDANNKDELLLKRVISAYGDDSVQQLANLHFVVENSSNLLSKKLEWGRLGAYLEQSTRYIYFDKKNANGKYKYFVPKNFKAPIKKQYVAIMNEMFENYSYVVAKLEEYLIQTSNEPESKRDRAWQNALKAQACDSARSMLPVSTQSTVGIFMSSQAVESLIIHLLSDPLAEAKYVGQQILTEARKVMPVFLERVDLPDRGGAITAYRATTAQNIKQLTNQLIGNKFQDTDFQDVNLVDYYPKNELDIIPDILYENSSLSLKELKQITSTWDYDKKINVMKTYFGDRLNRRQKPGRALEKIIYNWDLMCDYGIFRDLQRHRIVNDLEWQSLSPRYGFDTPDLIDRANLTDKYERNFAISLKLHSLLIKNGYELESQYSTLLGHKMRFKVTYNAREAFHLHELRTNPQGHSNYRKLVLSMHDKVNSVHPIIASGMKFINKNEDPALSRLAAERYAQFKLANLS